MMKANRMETRETQSQVWLTQKWIQRAQGMARNSGVGLLAVALLISTSAFAKDQRVLVKMKNSNIFKSMASSRWSSQMVLPEVLKIEQDRLMKQSFPNLQVRAESFLRNLNSVVVQINDADLNRLRQNRNVEYVDVEVFHPAPKPVWGGIFKPMSQRWTAATEQTPWGIVMVKAMEAWPQAKMGEGSRVLILDTGIDKDHPALKDNFEKGENFVNDSPSPYPFFDGEGHGTHVAGTIAASLNANGFTGVAPKAKILMGRVCSEQGCSNISVARGIEWGIEQQVDVVSMSLGGPWATPSEREAVEKATAAGITLVAASGNDGVGQVGYPAALKEVIAVGAVDNTGAKAKFSQWGPELAITAPGVSVISSVPQGSGRSSEVGLNVDGKQFETVKSAVFQGSKTITQPVENVLVYAGLGREEDFAKVDVKDKFALIERGEIRFSEKAQNAIKAGASGAIIFNNVTGMIRGSLTEDGSELSIPVFMIEQDKGQMLVQAMTNGAAPVGRMAINVSDYAAFDGTSMATPHVSGVVALMKAANKSLSPAQVKEIIRKTAVAVDPALNTQNEYGAGIINAQAAVEESVKTPPVTPRPRPEPEPTPTPTPTPEPELPPIPGVAVH